MTVERGDSNISSPRSSINPETKAKRRMPDLVAAAVAPHEASK